MNGEVTFEEVQQFISKYTVLQITPESRLVKDLYFKWKDGLKFLYAFASHFGVNILPCQPRRHLWPKFNFAIIWMSIVALPSLISSAVRLGGYYIAATYCILIIILC